MNAQQVIKEQAEIRLNELSFALLGVLLRQPCTGYDAVKALEKFRPVKISQVYPLLSDMEARGLLVSKEVVQKSRPNKKVYHTTDLARVVLRDWLDNPTDAPVQRDEFVSKAYSMWCGAPEQRKRLLEGRLAWLQSEIEFFDGRMRVLHSEYGELVDDPDTWQFCRNVLMARRLMLYHDEILWCHRTLARLESQTVGQKLEVET